MAQKPIVSNKLLILVAVSLAGLFLWLQIRPSLIKKSCYKTVYITRENEDNFEWAEGKEWLPKPGKIVRHGIGTEPWVWIYLDQSDNTNDGIRAASKRKTMLEDQYNLCLKSKGL